MEHKKVNAGDLRIGMYVAELDRPWLDSPFLFQGFTIQDEQDLKQLRETCDHVFIDLEKSGDVDPAELEKGPPEPGPEVPDEKFTDFKEEVTRAREVRDKGTAVTSKLLEDVRLGESVNSEDAREVVSELIATISSNPNASIWLTNLKRKNEYLAAHCMDTCVLAVAFARHLGYGRDTLEDIGHGALLHDVGMMRTPQELLEKKEPLTDEEFNVIKRHPVEGYNVLRLIPGIPETALNVVHYHHERYDGSGYPKGLVGEDIPMEARIVGIADAYDSMTSPSSYSSDIVLPQEALGRLRERAATDFGGDLVEQFMRCIGIYPVGSLVQLGSGALAVVISHNQRTRLRPVVMMLRDGEGNPYASRPLVNLDSLLEGMDADRWQIQGVRDPKDFGIDLEEIADAQSRG